MLSKWIISAVAIFVLSQILFLINIQFPRAHSFDEFHYIPAAKNLIQLKADTNPAHPPLGKFIIGLGIAIDDDRPFGWRWPSALFGSMIVLALFFFSRELFGSFSTSLFVALLAILSQMLYVLARAAMLDIFVFGFSIWAIYFFYLSYIAFENYPPRQRLLETRKFLILAGILFGLAISTRWTGTIYWVLAVGGYFIIRQMQSWKIVFSNPSPWKDHPLGFADWYSSQGWKGISQKFVLLTLIAIPLTIYFFSFIPLLFLSEQDFGVMDIIRSQLTIFQTSHPTSGPHPYQSPWYEWFFMNRPTWFAFDQYGVNIKKVRAVICMGNPMIVWGGLISIIVTATVFFRTRLRSAGFLLGAYFISTISWTMIPPSSHFFYCYFPSLMFLCLTLGLTFHYFDVPISIHAGKLKFKIYTKWIFASASLVVFVYFFPIMSAMKIRLKDAQDLIWFDSWF